MSNADVNARGLALVANEFRRRGWHVQEVSEGRRKLLRIDGRAGRRLVKVSIRTSGDWQTSIDYGAKRISDELKDRLWIFVDAPRGDAPEFYVVPYGWMAENIYEVHSAYLRAHGGVRAQSPTSTHHGVKTSRIAEWVGRWDLAGAPF